MHFIPGGSKSSSMIPTILRPGIANEHIKIYQTPVSSPASHFSSFPFIFIKEIEQKKNSKSYKESHAAKTEPAVESPHMHLLLMPKSLNSIQEKKFFFYLFKL